MKKRLCNSDDGREQEGETETENDKGKTGENTPANKTYNQVQTLMNQDVFPVNLRFTSAL